WPLLRRTNVYRWDLSSRPVLGEANTARTNNGRDGRPGFHSGVEVEAQNRTAVAAFAVLHSRDLSKRVPLSLRIHSAAGDGRDSAGRRVPGAALRGCRD